MADKAIIDEAPPPPEPDDDEPSGITIDSEAWMLSFGDLVSLMLVFFVMLFAMSTLEDEKYEAIVSALAQSFNPTAVVDMPVPSQDQDIPKTDVKELYSLDYLRALLEEKLAGDALFAHMGISQRDDRLVISLPADQLFTATGARLADGARETVARMGTVIRFVGNRVDVDGNTDPSPVADASFPSNWELSLARAMAVADELRAGGYVDTINAFGLADTHFAEISLDLRVDERYRRARRVDIVVRKDRAEEGTP